MLSNLFEASFYNEKKNEKKNRKQTKKIFTKKINYNNAKVKPISSLA